MVSSVGEGVVERSVFARSVPIVTVTSPVGWEVSTTEYVPSIPSRIDRVVGDTVTFGASFSLIVTLASDVTPS